ncbi:uncharacterized protein LOC126905600 [Daktulosphaira vitifoliae]|uniref:uncharacterized protein LOC126905600 n=1 Tax=Daktulosphaira vitifoliae TaxID=58002 RepID=UPI0021AAD8DB|nr:uncharacterized protein LOC126905600 [Daktulosphaira vitifoliae]XP_050541440.1 uncharacterized protein LOC126905600 [Daktulosphaira vitifoliae]XP_050541450.1 uncharacterized protein LOC126905600 [Daktulosphaira vitifoliae]
MVNLKLTIPNTNNNTHDNQFFKQTFKFTKTIYKQKLTPDGFLIRDCGCVMRFLPSKAYTLNMKKEYPTHVDKKMKNVRIAEINKKQIMIQDKKINKKSLNFHQASLYQSTFWMEPRAIPIKYTSTVDICFDSPLKIFTEKIDLQMKLVPCQYIEQNGSMARFKTSIETQIYGENIFSLDSK